jgi:FkbM family methyltransferase
VNPPDLTAYLSRPSPIESELRRLFWSKKKLVIFDVGACEGEESIRYARLFPSAQILTFEPLPANQDLIRANFQRHRIASAELIPLALSDRSEMANFHVSSGRPPHEFSGPDWNYGNKSSSLLAPAESAPMYGWLEFKETIRVRTETLDQVCRERGIDEIDFLHLDVQGAEHRVLVGALGMLPHISAVWLEVADRELYRDQKLRDDIERFLRQQGFSLGFEQRREIEGDQFYVNRRKLNAWRYLALTRTSQGLGLVRRAAGRLKHFFAR